jgi:hypothetical protein
MDQMKNTILLTPAAGQTLTGSYAKSATSARVSKTSSQQFEVLYIPGDAPDPAKYLDCYLEYTNVKDTEAPAGQTIPADADWHPYKEELDDGAGTSTFFVRHWKIISNDATLQVDLSAVFTRPLFVERVRLKMKEFGSISVAGKAIVKCSTKAV